MTTKHEICKGVTITRNDDGTAILTVSKTIRRPQNLIFDVDDNELWEAACLIPVKALSCAECLSDMGRGIPLSELASMMGMGEK
jgi:hypothetical protein